MKKVKNQKKIYWHPQADLKGIWNNIFLVLTQNSKIIASVHCAYARKIIKIEEIKNLTFRHLNNITFFFKKLLKTVLKENGHLINEKEKISDQLEK